MEKTFVYIVVEYNNATREEHISMVFSDREKAEKYIKVTKNLKDNNFGKFCIEEYPID